MRKSENLVTATLPESLDAIPMRPLLCESVRLLSLAKSSPNQDLLPKEAHPLGQERYSAAMPSDLHLLGQPRLADSELPPTKPVYLLLYLAYSGEWVGREVLAEVFAPESDEEAARRTLRVLLNRAKALSWAEDIEVEPTRLRWRVPSDVRAFREAIGQGDWPLAVRLHQHMLLEGFPIKDAPGFEAWLELERETLLGAWREAALRCGLELGQRGQHSQAAQLLLQLLHHDPLAEDVLAAYMGQAYLSGQREDALNAYNAFAGQLRSELGLEPLERTQQLVEQIRRVEPLAVPAADTVSAIPLNLLRPPNLVGREGEQGRLLGSGQAVTLIAGEPGVGKTRLLSETFPQAEAVQCREGLENLPFYPILEYLKPRLAGLSNLGAYREDLARLIPELMPGSALPPSDPQSAKLRLLEALARALEGSRTPLIFDDLQWADSATLELLLLLATRGKRRLLGTYRKGEIGELLAKTLAALRSSHNMLEIILKPLSKDDFKHLLAGLIGLEQGPPLFSEWLHRRSGGNMFFALETLKAMFENGSLRLEGNGWSSPLDQITKDYSELEVPPRMAEVIERRVGRLSEPARRVLGAVSVLGAGVKLEAGLLAGLTGLGELAAVDALDEAERAGLLTEGGFAHDLFRQNLYAAISPARRTLLHGMAAQRLEGHAEAALVARHYQTAGQPQDAARLYHQAALDDLRRTQHASAIANFHNGLGLAPDGPLRLELLVGLGTQLILENAPEAAHTLEEALPLARQLARPDLEARCLGGLLEAAVFAGDKPQAQHWRVLAEPWLGRELLPEVRVSLLESLIEDSLRDGAYLQAQTYLDQALVLDTQSVSLRAYQAQILYYKGQFFEAKGVFEHIIAQYPQWVRVLALENDLAMACLLYGALGEAKDWLERSLQSWAGVPHMEALSCSNLGLVFLQRGELDLAMARLEQAQTLTERFGSKTFLAEVAHRRSGVWFAAGQPERAFSECNVAVALAREVGDPFRLGMVLAASAVAYGMAGQSELAQQLLVEAEALYSGLAQPTAGVYLSRSAVALALAAGDLEAAQPHLERWVELTRRHQMRDQLAWALITQAGLADPSQRQGLLEEALELARQTEVLPLRQQAAQALAVLKGDPALSEEAQQAGERFEAHRQNLLRHYT